MEVNESTKELKLYKSTEGNFIEVSGLLESDGSIHADGKGTVAGFPHVEVIFDGKWAKNVFTGIYEQGTNGVLPGGKSILWEITLQQ